MTKDTAISGTREKNKIRQARARASETEGAHARRLAREILGTMKRRAQETNDEKHERLDKDKKLNGLKRGAGKEPPLSRVLSSTRKELLWRMINQNTEPNDAETKHDLQMLLSSYDRDSKAFIQNIRECARTLKRRTGNVPRFSKANIPIPDSSEQLQGLSFIEQMLISPVLPMVFVWRYKTFGQYQSKGQCVAFRNQVQKVAEVLPRTLTEIFVNVKDIYGHFDITIRIKKLREALAFLKLHHPAYEAINIREKNFDVLENDIAPPEMTDSVRQQPDEGTQIITASQTTRDAGQNQIVEEHIAQASLAAPLTIGAIASKEDISKSVRTLFKSISRRDNSKYASQSALEGWPLMFPCLLWNGQGGPDSCIYKQISLREWINYVIRIPSLDFRKNVIFISFANIILRRQQITGLTAHKPISSSIEQAVKELIHISKSERPANIPESTLNALSGKVAAYDDELPGSLSDMRKFRSDILSMMKKHGSPTYFLTLSSADSMWPEGFVAATNGEITMQQARELSSIERANLMATNPVAFTEIWKKRVQAFLELEINGESKTLGEKLLIMYKKQNGKEDYLSMSISYSGQKRVCHYYILMTMETSQGPKMKFV